uniref:Metalloendopeptidase n=1 Tax=Parastrongyloides trichosuri TaxID=131310 RepID=A0A0N4ZGD3_PARTI
MHLLEQFILITIYFYNVNQGFQQQKTSRTCSGVIYSGEDLSQDRTKRSIYINMKANWTQNIKYFIHKNVYRPKIISVFNFLMRETCLKFEETNNVRLKETQIEFILSKDLCFANIGRKHDGKNTQVKLTYYCAKSFGTTGHEILHALGVGHEHQRPDRDSHIRYNKHFIKDNYKMHITDMYYSFEMKSLGIPYDYASIMHYRKTAFSKNGKNTIEAKKSKLYNKMMGHEAMFTFNDIKVLNYYYCRKQCSYFFKKECKNGGYVKEPQCFKCICPKEYEGDKCEKVKDRSYNCSLETYTALTSPTFFYKIGRKRCVFFIKASEGKRIELYLKIVVTKEKDYCLSDVGLEIKYLNDKGTTGLCLCGLYENIKIISESNEVVLTFTGLSDSHMFIGSFKEIFKSGKEKSMICYDNQCNQ